MRPPHMEILEQLWLLVVTLVRLTALLAWTALVLAPAIFWIAWWLWATDWRKFWPTLAHGGWAPVVLIALIVALALTMVVPASQVVLGVEIGSPWWQLGAVTVAVLSMLVCGWLQGILHWEPAEPPQLAAAAATHDHGHHGQGHPQHHGHEHGHDHTHGHAGHGHH
ncbi:MAG: hypothetical protein NZM31_11740 [Gemmatales bacterium]|nr:hypothetical protein [Gemmatales bacterium]MDW8387666.1 hypothetical protein [Gemmatales bacterium]